MATPALELIERANRDANEARLARTGGSAAPKRWSATIRSMGRRVVQRLGFGGRPA